MRNSFNQLLIALCTSDSVFIIVAIFDFAITIMHHLRLGCTLFSSSALPLELGIFGNRTSDQTYLMEKIVEYYKIKDLRELDDAKVNRFLDACGDTSFNYGIDQTVKLHAARSAADTFFYHLTFPALHSLSLFRTDHSIAKHPLTPMW